MSTGGDDHLSVEERDRIERFLALFTGIEAELQRRLRVPATPPFNRLLRDYRQRNPYWQDDAENLGHYAQIRNFLTHERTPEFGYPVAVTRRSEHVNNCGNRISANSSGEDFSTPWFPAEGGLA